MSINLALATELKAAGFPQNLDGNRQMNGEPMMFHAHGSRVHDHESCAYVPSLSELIEACGEDFASVGRLIVGGFFAVGWKGEEEIETDVFSTPEQALSRLWLALHTKNK
jgi:hypothetical protein